MELAKYTASLGSIAFSFITSLSEAQFYKSDSHFSNALLTKLFPGESV